jgi:hypothetical protein
MEGKQGISGGQPPGKDDEDQQQDKISQVFQGVPHWKSDLFQEKKQYHKADETGRETCIQYGKAHHADQEKFAPGIQAMQA